MKVAASRPIPHLPETPFDGEPDLLVHCEAFPQFQATEDVQVVRDEDEPSLHFTIARTEDGMYVFDYRDGARFAVTPREIWVEWRAPLTFEDASTYLVGPILGFVARLRGATCLHASAVEIDGAAVVFPGATGAGKSTLAAALVRQGQRLIAEDVVPLMASRDGVVAIPTYPGIRLWPSAGELLFGHRDALPAISPSWDKRMFSAGDRFVSTPLPVGAIVFPEAAVGAEPSRIADVAVPDAALCAIGHSYRGEILDAGMRRRDFELLGQLATAVPARAIVVGRGARELERACELVLAGVCPHV